MQAHYFALLHKWPHMPLAYTAECSEQEMMQAPSSCPPLRPHRLTVRTPGFHPGNRSSILREVTKKSAPAKLGYFSWLTLGLELRLPLPLKAVAIGSSTGKATHRSLLRAWLQDVQSSLRDANPGLKLYSP